MKKTAAQVFPVNFAQFLTTPYSQNTLDNFVTIDKFGINSVDKIIR